MRYQKMIAPMVLCLLFVFSWPHPLPAAEQKSSAPKAAEKASLKSEKPIPLQQPLKAGIAGTSFLCMNLINSINGIIQIAHKDLQASTHLYAEKGGDHLSFPGIWELYYYQDMYRSKVQACCSDQKSSSV